MLFRKAFFCIPPFPGRYGSPTHPHTGIGYLCESLNKNGVETAVVDFRLGNGYRELHAKIKYFKPDLFGVTMMSYYHNLAYEIVNNLKKYNIPVAAGGPHVSTLKEQVLRECGVDFGFKMESERAIVDFCKGKPFEAIPGLIYRKNGNLLQNEPEMIKELDEVVFPKYRDMNLSLYARKRIAIISSRGCPFKCSFCPIKTVMGRPYRFRSAENVFSELDYWYKSGYRDFDFQDDNFTVDNERVYRICDLIEDASLKDLFMQCGNGLRADVVTKELLGRMKEVGFKAVAFGVESANPDVLKKVKKGESIEKIDQAINIAIKAGIEVSLFFIVGLPGETSKSFKQSIDFALKYPVTTATFYNLIPFPGTELFDWVNANHYFILRPQDYLNTVAHLEFSPVFQTPDFNAQQRKEALMFGAKVSTLIKRRDMERKLGNICLSRILSWMIYESLLNKVLFVLIKIKPLKQAINFTLLKLRIRFNL